MLSNNQKLAFTAISEFVTALSTTFGSRSGPNRIGVHQRALDLYSRLLEHVNPGVVKPEVVVKHLSPFSEYLVRNMKDILARRNTLEERIQYNEKIYLALKLMLDKADENTKTVIWTHLLTITTILFPDSDSREVLQNLQASPIVSNEEKIIHQMIGEVAPLMEGAQGNPIAIATKLMKNGTFARMVKDMESKATSGELDVNNLIGSALKMFQSPGILETIPLNSAPSEENGDNGDSATPDEKA